MRKREGIERRQMDGMEADALKLCGRQNDESRKGEGLITPSASKTSACIYGSYTELGRTRLYLKGIRN